MPKRTEGAAPLPRGKPPPENEAAAKRTEIQAADEDSKQDDRITFTLFPDVGAQTNTEHRVSWDRLAAHVRSPGEFAAKAACPLIKLARFGEKRSAKNSLRHDANVLSVSGVEADYDAETVPVADAAMMLADAGIEAVIYSSPSHTPDAPRWRVLAPFSKPYPPGERQRFMARLQGALGGILAPESFTLSQSYYIGKVNGAPYEMQQIRGRPIDLIDELDACAIEGPVNGASRAERLEEIRTTDPVIRRLDELKRVIRKRSDGGVDIHCPFEAEHTTQGGNGDCTYWPAHTGGFAQSHFKCLHGHCANRTQDQFLSELGIKDCNAHTEIIADLAKLSRIEYDQVRQAKADELNVRVSTLDAEVKKRCDEKNAGDETAGRAMRFTDIEPWNEQVDGGALLCAIAKLLKRYIVMSKPALAACALWCMHTYAYDWRRCTPILAVNSPEKRCGKTTLMALLHKLVNRALAASNISPSAVFRTIDKARPTLLIDEADSFLRDNEELRGVLNSGHTRELAFVIRTVGEDHEPRQFSTWAPKALALIGKLPDTLHDRSIVIPMQRKRRQDHVYRFEGIDAADTADLTRKLVRWVNDHALAIRNADPKIPEGLHDRAADNWRPLLAIAELASERWAKRAKRAAIELSGGDGDENDSIKTLLLADLRKLFADGRSEKLPSEQIVAELAKMPERPWREFKREKPITERQLAGMLRPFGIKPTQVWTDGKNARGYEIKDFAEAFVRYLPNPPADRSARPLEPTNGAGSEEIRSARGDFGLADRKQPKPTPDNDPSGLADRKTGNNQDREALEKRAAIMEACSRLSPPAEPDFEVF